MKINNLDFKEAKIPPPPPPPPPLATLQETNGPKLVKLNWKPIMPIQLTKECVWRKYLELEALSEDILLALSENFTSKLNKKNLGSGLVATSRLQVIDERSAYKLSILLRSRFQKSTFEEIKQYILCCDTTILKANFITELIKCLPQEKQVNKLRELRNENITLIDTEDFLASLCDIYRIVPRLHCIKFLIEFNDMVEDVEKGIKVASVACNEVLSCSRFHKILRLVLSIGNIMNAGTRIGEAVAFELPALTTLIDTRSSVNKRTLLDFIVETVAKKYPDLLYFCDGLCHLHQAVDIKFSDIEETIKEIDGLLHFVESEVEKVKAFHCVHDITFIDIMSGFITHHNIEKVGQLKTSMRELRESYLKVASFFAFDVTKYNISACMKDITAFKNAFKQKLAEITKCCKPGHNISKIQSKPSGCMTINGSCRDFTIKLNRLTEEGKY